MARRRVHVATIGRVARAKRDAAAKARLVGIEATSESQHS
jgi:hypothetical protein